jgi:DNA-directed RNA polymerase specialized sigma24 family protein
MSTNSPGALVGYIRSLVEDERSSTMADDQLLERFIAGGDQQAFAALVQRHAGLVWGVSRRVLDREHDAEDVFQATFLVLARKAGTIYRPHALAGWLFGVANRIARKVNRDATSNNDR